MSSSIVSLHIDDSQSVFVGRPELSQGDPKSCDDPKIRLLEEVDEAVAGKDVDNVKRKEEEKVAADDLDDENVTKKRKSAVESQISCESIPETTSDTVPATHDDVDDMKVKNTFSTKDERLLLDLERLAFEHVPKPSQSQHNDGFFCTHAPKADMGQSSHGGVESNNVDINKELESFRVHVDSNFAEILQAIVDLKKKVDAKRGLPILFLFFS
ncbi:hypothetical protein K7X08_013815 [Anisodus acutangulus]|uniref:Uncharacterized protein n=1 Tax=Anisodus acutangulus TaxID=402998 RepID=A0A9Q1LP72_9SOLA|nr:hypothetical protein K7X08_013815 [Anisodus acutangulus]